MVRQIVLSFLVLLLATACTPIDLVRGSGNLVTVDYDLAGFDQVRASSAFNVSITQGDSYKVSITADDNVIDRVVVEANGDTLSIGMKPVSPLANPTLVAEITMPSLSGVDFSGATSGYLAGFGRSGTFTGKASGASRISGEVEADSVDLDLSGASNAALTGSADRLRVAASGASKAMLADFQAANAEARASGSSHIEVNVSGLLTGDASGAAGIRYTGDPEQVRVRTSGASSVGKLSQ